MAWPVRYKVIGLVLLSSAINYIDRVNISVAAPIMMQEIGWDKARFGIIFSAFLVGYALLQFPGGILADKWSARKLLALSFCGFSLFTALTPLGQKAFFLMLTLRVMVGMFESVTFPAVAALNSRWIPRQEFGRAQTLSISGATIGQMLAYPMTTWIILSFSWQAVFYFNAVLGFLWAVLWLSYSTDTPREHRSVSPKELDYIETNTTPKSSSSVPLRLILKSSSVLSLCLSYMFFVFSFWVFIFWFPTYLVEARKFSLQTMGWLGMLSQGVGFLGTISGGVFSDSLLRRKFSPRAARARFAGISVALSIPFLVAAVMVPSSVLSFILFTLFYYLYTLAVAGFWSIPLELNPHSVGAISGVMNGLGNVAGIFGPMSAGFIVSQTGNWALPFYVSAVFGVFCALIFFMVPVKPICVGEPQPALISAVAAESNCPDPPA